MIDGKRVIALIPARGGSKRLPRKNILSFASKPLVAWTIIAAKESQFVDDIFISTDDKEVVTISAKLGIDVPELRPQKLSTDYAKAQDVLFYTLDNFGNNADIIILLQPTSPLRTALQIDESISLLLQNKAESIVSVTPCEHPPQWSNTLPESASMEGFLNHATLKRSQDLEKYYRLNGAIYVFDVKKLKNNGEIRYTSESYAYVMDNACSIDIDTELDFLYAELIMKKRL